MNPLSPKRPDTAVRRVIVMVVGILPLVLSPGSASGGAGGPAREIGGDNAHYLPVVSRAVSRVLIPAGTFIMGCDPAHNGGYACGADELPLHTVYLDAYLIDQAEVTNVRYEACVADGACAPPSDFSSNMRPNYYGNPVYAHYPVVHVNWNQAAAFCAWAGGRLPSEAEWEKAARREDETRAYPWGDFLPSCFRVNGRVDGANCVGDTTAAGSYSPLGDSPHGLYDMSGNVYEWLNDWYSATYYQVSPASNPPGPESGTHKIRRAGAYGSWPNFLRVAVRIPTTIPVSRNYIGFRCAYAP